MPSADILRRSFDTSPRIIIRRSRNASDAAVMCRVDLGIVLVVVVVKIYIIEVIPMVAEIYSNVVGIVEDSKFLRDLAR